MNTTPRNHIDEREWQLQERALQEERDATPAAEDPALAQYRRVARALRQPLPHGLPADFAARLAVRVGRAALDTRFEQAMTGLLVALLAIAAVVVADANGSVWLRESLALLPARTTGFAINWGLALAACAGLSWSLERLHQHRSSH